MTRTATAFFALLATAFCGCWAILEAGTTAYETHCIQSGQRTVTECKLLARGR